MARLEDYETLHEASGKHPVMFVMAADTDEADQIAKYLEALQGFGGRVSTIHTNRQGEISESARGKDKELLEKLRRASRVDLDTNPYRAIVSVLMLREGWDVRNVTVIVGLRAYTTVSAPAPRTACRRVTGRERRPIPASLLVIAHRPSIACMDDCSFPALASPVAFFSRIALSS